MKSVAVVQMVSCGAVGPNLVEAKKQVQYASDQGAQLIVLPEAFAFWPAKQDDIDCVAETHGSGRIQDWVSRTAEEFGVWIVAGSIHFIDPDSNRLSESCLVYDDQGRQRACYNRPYKRSSDEIVSICARGEGPVVIQTPFGCLGLAFGYDLYFADHFAKLKALGAQIVAVPSAFLLAPGKAHFKPLVQVRAIENQFFMMAANQGGLHDNGLETYGGSRIVGPWGLVLDTVRTGSSVAKSSIDLLRIDVLSEEFPLNSQSR